MHEASFLRDLITLLGASLPIVFLCQRLQVPALVGFLITGTVIGPAGAGLIRDSAAVHELAEVGVVLLLFTIGLEFSLARLARMGKLLVGGGAIQVVTTTTVAALLTFLFGVSGPGAVVFGFVTALSSTAIVLKLLADRAQIDSPHGRIAVAILLFQDLCIVPMMMVLPLLGQPEGIRWLALARALGVALLTVALVIVAGRLVLPIILHQVVRLRISELFVATVILLCFGTAWITAQFGLSLAIGAFLAGLVISESEYSHQVVADVLPFRDLFSSIFFMSMGMLIDVQFLRENAALVGGLVAAIMILKILTAGAAVLPFHGSRRVALLVGISLSQIGEFSFVLAEQAAQLEVISEEQLHLIINAAGITMLLSPVLLSVFPFARMPTGGATPEGPAEEARGHVVVIGYGLNGRNLARVLRETRVPYRIIDLNGESVQSAGAQGEPIFYGDATREAVLRHANVDEAAVVVVAISDPAATRRVVHMVRHINPMAAVIARTRYLSEITELKNLGAGEVVAEEFETSVEIFARVLRRLHIPPNMIQAHVDLIRGEGYAMLRGAPGAPAGLPADIRAILGASTTETFLLPANSPAAGRSIRDLNLRQRSGATILAVVRDGRPVTNPAGEYVLEAGDVLVLLGDHAALARAHEGLKPPSGGNESA